MRLILFQANYEGLYTPQQVEKLAPDGGWCVFLYFFFPCIAGTQHPYIYTKINVNKRVSLGALSYGVRKIPQRAGQATLIGSSSRRQTCDILVLCSDSGAVYFSIFVCVLCKLWACRAALELSVRDEIHK
jgi:hypothetical protein